MCTNRLNRGITHDHRLKGVTVHHLHSALSAGVMMSLSCDTSGAGG